MTQATKKPPKTYEITHLAKKLDEDKDFDAFVVALCDEISEVVENRKDTLEPEWDSCEQNYWATGDPKARGDRDAQLDFTITFEICRHAGSNISNPVFAQDQVFVGKGRPGFTEMAAAHDVLIDWMADRSKCEAYVNNSIRGAQIFTKSVVKSAWSFRERVVRYWAVDAEVEPI